jgi:hypothetical protein
MYEKKLTLNAPSGWSVHIYIYMAIEEIFI